MAGGVIQRGGSGRRGRRRRNSHVMSEINITPFVDVMLVLLIIFMVAAPLMTVGVPVKLPETAATALSSEQEEPLTVTLTVDGRLLIQTTETEPDVLIGKLRAIALERSDNKIFLRADGAIPYERVMQVMGALNAGGFRDIGLVTDSGGPSFDGSDG
ncbi:MAG: protein TolR [Paracoccaceae bacterium]